MRSIGRIAVLATAWLAAAAGFGLTDRAIASDRTVVTGAGQPVVLGRPSQWRKDCSANGLPVVDVNRKPANGEIKVSAGTGTVRSNRGNPKDTECIGKEVPAALVTYHPKAGFVGTDSVTYTVTYRSTRKFTDTITINVLPQAEATAPTNPSDTTRATSPGIIDAALPPTTAPAPSGSRIALVIGNSAYRNVPALANPGRDANSVAAALRASGFKTVQLQSDLTRETLTNALHKFASEADRADWAVVYYAGHGIEVNGTNYLIPIDATLAVDRDVEFETVPLDRVMSAVGGARKLRLVLLDACRDNPFANKMKRSVGTRSAGRGLASVEPEAGTLVVFAAKAGQVASDGSDGNSPFVASLIKRMSTPGLEIRRLFDHVRDDVLDATRRQQQPFSYGSLPGSEDYFFRAASARR